MRLAVLLSCVVACSDPPAPATTDLVPATWHTAAPDPSTFPDRCAVSVEPDLPCTIFHWLRAQRAHAWTEEYVRDR